MTTPRSPRSPRSVALSTGVYRWLLYAYPGAFRRAYGREMAQVFRETCRAAHARAGLGGVALLWLPLLGDVLINAAREQVVTLRRSAGGGSVMGIDEAQAGRLWIGWTAAGAVAWGGGLLGAILLDMVMAQVMGPRTGDAHATVLIEVTAQGLLLIAAQAALLRRYAPHVRWWAGATAGGILLTLAVAAVGVRGDITAQSNAYGVILLCEGAMVGGVQWLALRRQVAGVRWWVLATALGWAIGEIARFSVVIAATRFYFFSGVDNPWVFPTLFILGATLGGAVYGALLGRFLVVLLRQAPQVADLTV